MNGMHKDPAHVMAIDSSASPASLSGHGGRAPCTIQAALLAGYAMVYIFMQTFAMPGTVSLSLLSGALFGVVRGLLLVAGMHSQIHFQQELAKHPQLELLLSSATQ